MPDYLLNAVDSPIADVRIQREDEVGVLAISIARDRLRLRMKRHQAIQLRDVLIEAILGWPPGDPPESYPED